MRLEIFEVQHLVSTLPQYLEQVAKPLLGGPPDLGWPLALAFFWAALEVPWVQRRRPFWEVAGASLLSPLVRKLALRQQQHRQP